MLRDLFTISPDKSNNFTFDIEFLIGIKRKLIVVPKISMDASFRELIVPDKLQKLRLGLISDSHLLHRVKIDLRDLENVERRKEKEILPANQSLLLLRERHVHQSCRRPWNCYSK